MGGVVVFGGAVAGQPEEVVLEDPAVAEIERELRAMASPWQTSVEVAARGGWRDNVLFSSYAPQASGFVGGTADAMGLRSFGRASSVELYGSVDYRHYLGGGGFDDEVVAYGMANLGVPVGRGTLRMGLEYVFQDQPLDVSVSEAELSVTNVLGHGFTLRPVLREELGDRTWLELEGRVQRSFYEPPLDDAWEGGGGMALGFKPGKDTELSVGYGYDQRWYDTEPERTASGEPVDGSSRSSGRHELKLSWRQAWDRRGRWRTTARVGGRLLRDGASGYYDYDRVAADLRVRYETGRWRAEAGGRVAWYEYRRQTISAEDGTARERQEVALEALGQCRIQRHVAVFVECAWERTLSNRPGDEYGVSTIGAGVRLEY